MKGIAVAQIIMLVLGIIVLAVIGYLLYSNFLSSTGQLSNNQCEALAIDQCKGQKLFKGSGWDGLVALNLPQGCGTITNTGAAQPDVPCGFNPNMKCFDYDPSATPKTKVATTASSCAYVGVS